MSRFNLDDYEPVADRLDRFHTDHPDGRVCTDLIHHADDQWIVKATVYRDQSDVPAATGYAHELKTAKGVNATSALENCETSAVGRALANLNYAPKAARPSREEMAKVQRAEPASADDMGRVEGAIQVAQDLGVDVNVEQVRGYASQSAENAGKAVARLEKLMAEADKADA
jgi:hypothetical protein